MGRISEYQRSPQQSLVDTSAIESAGRIGRDISALAEQGSNLAFRAQEMQDNNFVAERAQKMENGAKEAWALHQSENAANPVNTYAKLQEKLASQREALLADAPSPQARQRLMQAANGMESSFKTLNTSWELEQGVKNTGTTSANGFDQIQTEALRASNPNMIPALEQKGQIFIDNLAKVASPQIVEKARSDFRKNIALSTFEGMINSDRFSEAEKALNSKAFDEHLGADGILHLQKQIKQGMEAQVARRANIESLKWTNPYEYAQKVGETKGLAPLDPQDPMSFRQRQVYVDNFNEKYGTAMPLLSKDEVAQFSIAMTKGNPTQQAAIMQNLASSLAPAQFTEFSTQIFKQAPEMGAALSLSQTSPDVTASILKGAKLLKNKAVLLSGTNEETVRLAYESKVKRSISDPVMRNMVYQSVRAISAAKAYDAGDTAIDSDKVDKAIDDVLGPIVTINDREALSFKNQKGEFLDSDAVEEAFEDLTANDLKSIQGDVPRDASGAAIPMDEIQSNYYLETVGDGLYYVKNKESQTYAADGQGRPFELQLKNIYYRKNGQQVNRENSPVTQVRPIKGTMEQGG